MARNEPWTSKVSILILGLSLCSINTFGQESCAEVLQRLLLEKTSSLYWHLKDSPGLKARFEFRTSPPIEGHVVYAQNAPHLPNVVGVIDSESGILHSIPLAGQSAPVKIEQLESAPRLGGYQRLDSTGAELGQKRVLGVVAVTTQKAKLQSTTYLYGKVRHLGKGLYEIDTLNGAKHHVDTRFANVSLSPDLSAGRSPRPWSKRTPDVISLYDPLEKERLQWATKITDSKVSPLKNSEYYTFLENHLDDTRTLIERWYDSEASSMLNWVEENLGKRFIPLLTDPGLANRFKQFQAFAPKVVAEKPAISLLELRQAFSDSLGTRKVFRGMVLSKQDLDAVKETGIASRLFLTPQRSQALSEYMAPHRYVEDSLHPRTPMEAIDKKYSSYEEDQEAVQSQISTTDYPEIAETIGYRSGSKSWTNMLKEKKGMYVFELEVPELDLVRNRGLLNNYEKGTVVPIVIGGKVFNMADYRIEYFTPFWLEPQAIRNIRKLENEPPRTMVPFTKNGVQVYIEEYYEQQRERTH